MDNQNNLPSTINGDGRKFISLLKNYLAELKEALDKQVQEVNKYFNSSADNPDTFDEQVSGITIEEKMRVEPFLY